MLANAIHRLRTRDESQGFTLIELIVAMLVTVLIMGVVAATFVTGIKSTNGLSDANANASDVKLLSAFFPADVQSVAGPVYDITTSPKTMTSPQGYLREVGAGVLNTTTKKIDKGGVICSGVPADVLTALAAGGRGVYWFGSGEWDKAAGKFTKNVTYSAEGKGKSSQLVRRECGSNGVTTTTATIAQHFGTAVLPDQPAREVIGIECTANDCTLSVRQQQDDPEGTYDYELTARRRVAGEIVLTTPCAPSTPYAIPGFQQTFVSWQEPVCDGGSPILQYEVRDTPPGTTNLFGPTVFSHTYLGLNNGNDYSYAVRARNAQGWSPWSSESLDGTPGLSTPEPPTVTGSTPGNRRLTITWQPPVSDGGSFITSWIIRAKNESGDVVTKSVPGNNATSSGTIDGLQNGEVEPPESLIGAYDITVSAVNAVGEGRPSEVFTRRLSTKPIPVPPGAPRNVQAVPQATKGQVRLSWDEPLDDGGSILTGYRITSSLPTTGAAGTFFAPQDINGNITSAILGNLPTGTPTTFYVVAKNAKGTGTAVGTSNTVNLTSVPEKVEPAPKLKGTGAVICLPSGQAANGGSCPPGQEAVGIGEVTFTAPVSNGSPILGYKIKLICGPTPACSRNGQITTTGPGLVQSVQGPTSGAMKVQVLAFNALGDGPYSDESNSDIFSSLPQPPTGLTAKPTLIQGQVEVSFTAPVNTGGRPIDHYEVDARKELSGTAGFSGATKHSTTVSSTSATSVVVSDLPVGYYYRFLARTVNTGPVDANMSAGSLLSTCSPAVTINANTTAAVKAQYLAAQRVCDPNITVAVAGGQPAVLLTAVPNPPTAVSATSPGFDSGGIATVTFTPAVQPAGTPAVTNYTITCQSCSPQTTYSVGTPAPDGNGNIVVSIGAASGANALPNGVPVTFTVKATNSVGDGAQSVQSAPLTIIGAPTAPTNVVATATGAAGSVLVSWATPASNGGRPIVGYRIDNITCDSPAPAVCARKSEVITGIPSSPYTVTGLTNGNTYRFRIQAVNNLNGPPGGTSVRSGFSNTAVPATVTNAPTNVSASVPGAPGVSGTATVTWVAPTDDGGNAITGYQVTASTGQVVDVVGAGTLTATFSNLTDGTPVTFTVRARNSVGLGAAGGPSASVIPGTIPGAPTDVTATPTNVAGELRVAWTAAPSGGPALSSHTVTAHCSCAVNDETRTTVGTAVAYTWVGLPNGVPITFTVRATNARGNGPISDPSGPGVAIGPPSAPLNVVASRTTNSGTVLVAWDPPADTFGSPVNSYVVRISGVTGVADRAVIGATSVLYTGLPDGTPVTFTVQAVNDAGGGAISAPSAPVAPWGVPDQPTGVIATPTGVAGQVTVAWDVPNDHTSAITGYSILDSEGVEHLVGPGSSATISGLAESTPISFIVAATNGAGTGPYSIASNVVTPAGRPDAPTPVVATVSGPGAVVLTFPTPAGHGAAVTGYTVTITCAGGTCARNGQSEAVSSGGTVTGLGEGGTASFSVVATNSSGNSPAAVSNTVTLPSRPGAPTGANAVDSGLRASVKIRWTPPASNGGLPITGYEVFSLQTLQTFTVSGAATSELSLPRDALHSSEGPPVVLFPDGGDVGFRVRAINAVGAGANSNNTALIKTPVVPARPTSATSVSAGFAGAVDVSWVSPANNSRSPITSYTVQIVGTPTSLARHGQVVETVQGSGALTIRITGLTSGGSYKFIIKAVNDVGASPPVLPATGAAPITAP